MSTFILTFWAEFNLGLNVFRHHIFFLPYMILFNDIAFLFLIYKYVN